MRNDKCFEQLFRKEIILYGAGITGVETYRILSNHFQNVNVVCFCDTFKSGYMSGLPIISPDMLKAKCHKDVIIIVTGLASNHSNILCKLQDINIPARQVYTLHEFDEIVMQNISDHRISDWYRTIKMYKGKLPSDSKRNLYLNWWCPEHYCKNDILVYQPGKVGSSTVCNSLSIININVTHVHMLTDKYIYDLIPELSWKPTCVERDIIEMCSQYCIKALKTEDAMKIITLVREPISRDYSQVMYHLDELNKNGCLSSSNSLMKNCAEGILKRATQNGKCKYGYQFEWFIYELKKVFGIDVYEYPFNKEQGYTIIKKNNIEVCVIKLEKLNILEAMLGGFTKSPHFKLFNANQAKNKNYNELYDNIRKTIVIPEEVISLYYEGNPYMNHFYDENEKIAFLRKWKH